MVPRFWSIPDALKVILHKRNNKILAYREKEVLSDMIKMSYRYTINRGIIGGPDDYADIFDCESTENTAQFCVYHRAGRCIDVTN